MKRVIVGVTVLFLCFCAFALPEKEIISVSMDPADSLNLNPYTATDSDSVIILQNLYEGLFSYNPETGEPENAIAVSYSVSDDGLTWEFVLDSKARFSDMSKITAQTFVDSWNFLSSGPLASNISFLESAEVSGNNLVMHLKYPVSYLPGLLCQPCLAAVKPTKASAFSGPYYIYRNSTEKLSLRKNRHYCGEVENDGVDVLFREDCSQLFKSGSVQWSMSYVDGAEEYMINAPLYATTFFYFSSSDSIWSDVNLRKALVQIIPWNAVKAIQQGLLVTDSLVPESNISYVDFTSYKKLLEEAGYTSTSELEPITMAVYRGSQVYMIAELIAKLWSRYLGVKVFIDTVPVSVYTTDPSSNPYDFCIVTWIGDYLDPMAFLSMFESNSSYNLANYSNASFDSLLEQAKTCDSNQRSELLKQAEQILLDDCVVVPLSNAISTNFVRTDIIHGWYDNRLDIHPFKYLSK